MKEINEYRQKLVQRLEQAVDEFCAACRAVSRPFDPIEAEGWSVHQVAAHTRDVDKLVYGLRTIKTLEQDNPRFPNFDSERYMDEHYDRGEDMDSLLAGLAASVGSLASQLRELPAEGWSRVSSHETQGEGLTLQTWVERGLDHLEEHLRTVKGAASR